MNLNEAQKIIANYYKLTSHSEEDDFIFEEACQFQYQYYLDKVKIDATSEATLYNLGMHYYNLENYDLAFKYLKLASQYDSQVAYASLGDFYYYGFVVEQNYEKSYEYYTKAKGIRCARLKIADMYKYGYYVEKDFNKYAEIILHMADTYEDTVYQFPEILRRLADVFSLKDKELAVKLFQLAKEGYSKELKRNLNFETVNEMKETIAGLYKLVDFDVFNFDLYDCFQILKIPKKITFTYQQCKHEIEANSENNHLIYRLDNSWFYSFENLLLKAKIDDQLLISISDKLEDFHYDS